MGCSPLRRHSGLKGRTESWIRPGRQAEVRAHTDAIKYAKQINEEQ